MFHAVRVGLVAVGVMMVGASGERVAAQSNLVPNPYHSILDWAKLPQGRIWGQMAALNIDSHGISGLLNDAEVPPVTGGPKRLCLRSARQVMS